MKTLFISDLHLDPKRTDIQACFDQFISSCLNSAAKIEALYILGDLFEVWLGDDASIPLYQHSVEQLRQLTDNNIKLYIMHGNRDFLLGDEFAQACGGTIIPDLYHLHINEQTILLSHGDIFCSDDTEYMQFRTMVREPVWQKDFLSQSIAERLRIAKSMRKESKRRGQEKQADIMDVNQNTVARIMLEHQVDTLIHGHTHRPATHHFTLNNQSAKRIVLPDWKPDAKIFEISQLDG